MLITIALRVSYLLLALISIIETKILWLELNEEFGINVRDYKLINYWEEPDYEGDGCPRSPTRVKFLRLQIYHYLLILIFKFGPPFGQ